VHDRQYVLSLVISTAVAALAIAGIVCLVFWLGGVVVVAAGAIALGFLAWFYLGPRPDLKTGTGRDGPDRSGNE
jgi:hypothetical protein